MGVMVQIRDLPEELHEKLKQRARASGLSLSDFLSKFLESTAAAPSKPEFWQRLKQRTRINTSVSAAQVIRESRDERDAQIEAVARTYDRR